MPTFTSSSAGVVGYVGTATTVGVGLEPSEGQGVTSGALGTAAAAMGEGAVDKGSAGAEEVGVDGSKGAEGDGTTGDSSLSD